jgi:hypothetical protein
LFFIFIGREGIRKINTHESDVLSGCLRYLEVRGIYHWRNNTGAVQIAPVRFMRFGKKGSSDILGILPGGRLLCVECKAPNGGRLSPEQKQFLTDVREMGALALVIRDWQDLDMAFREAGYVSDGPLFEGHNAAPYGGA